MSHQLLEKQINLCFSKGFCVIHQLQKSYCCVLNTCKLKGIAGCQLCLEQQKDHKNHPLLHVMQIFHKSKRIYLQRPQHIVAKQYEHNIQLIQRQKQELTDQINETMNKLIVKVSDIFNQYENRIKQIYKSVLSYEKFVYTKQQDYRLNNDDLKQFIQSTYLKINQDLINRQHDQLTGLKNISLMIQNTLQKFSFDIQAINKSQNSNSIANMQNIDVAKVIQNQLPQTTKSVNLSQNLQNCIVFQDQKQIGIINQKSQCKILKNNLRLQEFLEIETAERKIILALDVHNQFNIISQRSLKLTKKIIFEQINQLQNNQQWMSKQQNILKRLLYDDETKIATIVFPQLVYSIYCNLNLQQVQTFKLDWLGYEGVATILQSVKYNQFIIQILQSDNQLYIKSAMKWNNQLLNIHDKFNYLNLKVEDEYGQISDLPEQTGDLINIIKLKNNILTIICLSNKLLYYDLFRQIVLSEQEIDDQFPIIKQEDEIFFIKIEKDENNNTIKKYCVLNVLKLSRSYMTQKIIGNIECCIEITQPKVLKNFKLLEISIKQKIMLGLRDQKYCILRWT